MSDEVSVSSHSMRKWGLPEQQTKSNEVTLLERLVWVQYKNHWWPALLYDNYSELQTYLYEQLDMALKAQFAMAIMRQMQDSAKVRVARLLGRQILEVVEVEEDKYAEFYWQLPKVLPGACQMKRYGNDTELYLDFHRALDQVEEIIRGVSETPFNLAPGYDTKTWLQRGKDALRDEASTSAPKNVRALQSPRALAAEKRIVARDETKSASAAARPSQSARGPVEEENNPVFGAIDAMMESISRSFDGLTGATDIAKDLSNTAVANTATLNAGNSTLMHKYNDALASKKNRISRNRMSPLQGPSSKRSVADSIRVVENTRSSVASNRSKPLSLHPTDERRDPSPVDRKFKNRGGKRGVVSAERNVQRCSNEVLPGLEADDIVPGLGDVLRAMQNYGDEEGWHGKGLDAIPCGQAGSLYNPIRLPQLQEDVFMYEEMKPSVDVSPKKRGAVLGSSCPCPTRRPSSDAAKEPAEQRDSIVAERAHEVSAAKRDSNVAERALEVAAATQREGDETFWEFLTCHAGAQ